MPRMLVYCVAAALGCAPVDDQSTPQVDAVARQVIPKVEKAVGLKFKKPPTIAVRSRDQVQAYLGRKLDQDLPPAELEQITTAYRLFRLIPDTLDLRQLLIALYSEQVVGYYDPDSLTLYVVDKAPREQLRLVLAHELVHALQGQYVALDSLLDVKNQNDRRNAAQAVMEGQATLASVVAMLARPAGELDMPAFWGQYRETVRREQQRMPVFSTAPLLIREGLIFPYLAGADFVRWFVKQYPDTVPYGRRIPVSTEQILHPDRYLHEDRPADLRFARGPEPDFEDNLGEFETRILLTVLSGSESQASAGAEGWAGDRYGVFPAGAGSHALVWWTVWDTDAAARRFATVMDREWKKVARPDRRGVVERLELEGYPGVRLTDAPIAWSGWRNPPTVTTGEALAPGITAPKAMRRVQQTFPQRPL